MQILQLKFAFLGQLFAWCPGSKQWKHKPLLESKFILASTSTFTSCKQSSVACMLLHILHLSVDCCLGGELISRLAYVDFAGFDEDWEETAAIFDVGLLCAMPLLFRTVIHL